MNWPEPDERARWTETYSGVHLDWAPADATPVDMPCRNCGSRAPKRPLLDAHVTLPGQGRLESRLLECPDCGCAFARDEPGIDYEHNAANGVSVAFYVEVGAGLWPIVRAIARVERPPGSRYLEIGCGFGFGLDFATGHRGWVGRGIDPSPIAVAARHKLGLAIENRYFVPEEAATTDATVIMAGEVVEHIPDPLTFIRTLRAALQPGGVLVLTTPDRDVLQPGVPLAEMVPVLSVGAHVVLYTKASLRKLLELAGFTEIEVLGDAAQLTAYASTRGLRLQHDPAVLRAEFRRHMERRTETTEPKDYVWWGFASRAHQEAVVDGDWPTADRLWPQLSEQARVGFGFDLDDPESVPNLHGLRLWEIPDLVPKAIASLLYVRALQRLNGQGATLAQVAPLLRAAAEAAADLNEALRMEASEDGQTLGVERSCRGALAAEAADAGRAESTALLRGAVALDPVNRVALARRSYVGLVNAGRFELAGAVLDTGDVDAPGLDARPDGFGLTRQERDTLFCLGMHDLQDGGAPDRARRRFALVRDGLVRDGLARDGLWWSALRGECIAADRVDDHAHTNALLAAAGADGMPDDLLARVPPAEPADPAP